MILIILCIDASLFTLAFVAYIAYIVQESYCNGIMQKYNKLCDEVCGGNDECENEIPGGEN